jgi:hypothetical protein
MSLLTHSIYYKYSTNLNKLHKNSFKSMNYNGALISSTKNVISSVTTPGTPIVTTTVNSSTVSGPITTTEVTETSSNVVITDWHGGNNVN